MESTRAQLIADHKTAMIKQRELIKNDLLTEVDEACFCLSVGNQTINSDMALAHVNRMRTYLESL